MGERMLRRLRYELYDRILRFPPAHFRKVKQAELATMIKDEVEPLGGFIGDAFVAADVPGRPGADGDHLHPDAELAARHHRRSCCWRCRWRSSRGCASRCWCSAVCASSSARQLAGRIAETADGVHEIHIHGAANYERADISERLGRIFKIRFDLYQKKFVAKFWNNILSQATPFAIYLVGGYFAITGQMDVGAVVGVLLAYKDLPGPIKELIDWDQQRQDVQIKYEQVIDQFQPEGMMPEALQAIPDGPPPPLGKELALAGVTVSEDGRVKQLDGISLILPTAGKLAVIGGSQLGQGGAGPGAGAAHAALRRLDQARRQRLLPGAGVRAGRAHRLCRPGNLPVPALGARQPAVRPEDPAGRAGHLRRRDAAGARGVLEGGRARRQSGARSQRRLGRLRAGRRHRPGRPAAAHGRCPEAGRARRGHLFARPARHHRHGAAARPRREDPEGAPRPARPPAGSELCRPGRDVQCRTLQPQPVGGREPAVRHAGRQAVRRRQHRGTTPTCGRC